MGQTTPPRIRPGITPEQARAALANAAEQLAPYRKAMEQLARAHAANAQRVFGAFQVIVDHFQAHPELLEMWRREREASFEEQAGSCHCLCGMHHREQPDIECAGIAEPGLTIRYDSPTVGTQHVPMCRPCHAFHVTAPGPQEPLPAVEAPTDTCTCHCYANHPNTPGVCQAGSDIELDEQPLCTPCFDATTQHQE